MNTSHKGPVFISGHYRSGTTLLANILDKSPELNITYGTIHYLRSLGKYEPIESHYHELIKDTAERIGDKWDMTLDVEKTIGIIENTNGSITHAKVYDALMRVFLNLDSEARWGEKTNVHWKGLLPFTEMFSNGKAIHIVRDPRAVLASFKYFTFQPEPRYLDAIFAALAMFNHIAQEEISGHERILLLKYENLIASPKETVQKISNFLNIEFEPAMLDMSNGSKGKAYEANSSFFSDRSKIDQVSAELWRDKLSTSDIVLCESILKDQMQAWGYELLNLQLDGGEQKKHEALLKHPYIAQRLEYVAATGDGQQAFPDDEKAYLL